MSIFPWQRPGDECLKGRVAELERSLRQLAREHEAASARMEERIELIWLSALPGWLREEIDRARASGWTVVPSRDAIVFHRLHDGDEHQATVPMPLPDEDDELAVVRRRLMVQVRTFEHHAA